MSCLEILKNCGVNHQIELSRKLNNQRWKWLLLSLFRQRRTLYLWWTAEEYSTVYYWDGPFLRQLGLPLAPRQYSAYLAKITGSPDAQSNLCPNVYQRATIPSVSVCTSFFPTICHLAIWNVTVDCSALLQLLKHYQTHLRSLQLQPGGKSDFTNEDSIAELWSTIDQMTSLQSLAITLTVIQLDADLSVLIPSLLPRLEEFQLFDGRHSLDESIDALNIGKLKLLCLWGTYWPVLDLVRFDGLTHLKLSAGGKIVDNALFERLAHFHHLQYLNLLTNVSIAVSFPFSFTEKDIH